MKIFNATICIALLVGVLLIVQTEAQRRGSAGRRQSSVDQDELDEPQPPARRRQAARKYSPEDSEDEVPSSLSAASNSDDQSAGDQDYQPPRRASRRRYEQDEEAPRPARRRSSRRNSSRRSSSNNNNNLSFNGLPDGFPSAAFGAGFGAAVSSGGRGRGPSNAAGFGAGFAQSGGGNALAGGFGSGLVNNGYGGSRYDDDEDSDYDTGRVESKTTTNCILLQLVQSPSPSLQRLIEIRCRKPVGKFESRRDADIAASVARAEEPAISRVKSGATSGEPLDDEKEPEVASLDDGKSSSEEPTIHERTERIFDDRGNQILVSSSSYSNSRNKQHDNVEADVGIDDEYHDNNNNDE